jgi:predicted  nucleic acid-binding Zn-ribbon protein
MTEIDELLSELKEAILDINDELKKAFSIIRQLQADLSAANIECVRMRESKNRVETELDHTKATLTAMRIANASAMTARERN